jgi:cell division protein FtsB
VKWLPRPRRPRQLPRLLRPSRLARLRRAPRAGRIFLPVLATLLFLGVLVVGVFPTRTYLTQRDDVAAATRQLDQLQASNKAMQDEAKRLRTRAEIEALARRDHDMVMPGEEVYHVLPAPQVPLKVPNVWPFAQLQQRLDR